MSVDYQVAIVDWNAYTQAIKRIASGQLSSDEEWNLWQEIGDEHTSESDSEIEGTYYCDHGFGLATREIYLSVRPKIAAEQRDLIDRFLASLLPDYFYYGNPLETSNLHEPMDVDRKHVRDLVITVLSPQSVQQLFNETWCKIRLQEFEATVADNLKEEGLEQFESVSEFVTYVAEWGKLLQYAAENAKGIEVMSGC